MSMLSACDSQTADWDRAVVSTLTAGPKSPATCNALHAGDSKGSSKINEMTRAATAERFLRSSVNDLLRWALWPAFMRQCVLRRVQSGSAACHCHSWLTLIPHMHKCARLQPTHNVHLTGDTVVAVLCCNESLAAHCLSCDHACRVLGKGSELLQRALRLAEDRDKTRSKADTLSAMAQLHHAFIRCASCTSDGLQAAGCKLQQHMSALPNPGAPSQTRQELCGCCPGG